MRDTDIPVIIAGGSGSRLWPLSRNDYPKQFLSLTGGKSLLQQTVLRILKCLPHATAPIIVCNKAHRFVVAEQCRHLDIKPMAIILEPEGRNTAAAIALAAEYAVAQHNNPNLWVMPADHAMDSDDGLREDFECAALAIERELLVTFGVKVTQPATAYGYIKVNKEQKSSSGFYPVERFVEKPDADTARRYAEAGNYFWNSGMFAFNAKVFQRELMKHASMIYQSCHDAMTNPASDGDFVRPDEAVFVLCPENSVDYAIMEKTEHAAMVPLSVAWNDVGSWDALMSEFDRDTHGNVFKGDVVADNVSRTFVHAGSRLVAVSGVEDVVVVETPDAVLVANKKVCQKVKNIVQRLKQQQRNEVKEHLMVYRPWGWFCRIDENAFYKVKRICVNPHQALSLQRHQYRSEHWVIVKGVATVTNGDKTFELGKDKSTYIPLGTKHRLANNSSEMLELIEVQTGAYLGEDDIERFADQYGRVEETMT